MDLNEIVIFATVVQEKSFIKASRLLDIPKSTVSRKVAELEERLGARLLQRSTRSLSLTDVGHAYYQHAIRVVAEVEQAEHTVARLQSAPRGVLRVTLPMNAGFLSPAITSFANLYPDVRLSIYGTRGRSCRGTVRCCREDGGIGGLLFDRAQVGNEQCIFGGEP